MRVILIGILLLGAFQVRASSQPSPCSCRYAGKDYDPSKGYFFDKKTYNPLPVISYRMECLYYCSDKANKLWKVSYIHSETRSGHQVGGTAHAKHFVCDMAIKKFIPIYDYPEHIVTYEVELQGDFLASALIRHSAFKEFNQRYCKD